MRVQEVLKALESLGTAPQLKALAGRLGHSHELAVELWETGAPGARILAALVEEPTKVSRTQMDRWARAFDNWGVCDAWCCYVFRKTPFARDKAVEWSGKSSEFVKRAGFALMAYLTVHDKKSDDEAFAEWLSIIERESDDDRPYVRKAVNWRFGRSASEMRG